MTKQQIAILAGLGLAVLCVLCFGVYIVVSEESAYRASQAFTSPIPQVATEPLTTAPVPTDTPLPSGRVQAQVIRVIDSDTIEVSIDGQTFKVRYLGIGAPETKHPDKPVEPFGLEVATKNEELVGGKVVELEKDVSETDKYGRLLRYVWVGDLMVNAELVRLGYAQVSTYPPDVKYQDLFLQLQQEAREAGRGLWGVSPEPTSAPLPTDTPIPPADTPTVAPVPTDTPHIAPTNTPVPTAKPTATTPIIVPTNTPWPGGGVCPPGTFAASRESDKYHYPSCRWVEKILPENLICFGSVEEARAAGYEPCGTCKPP
jgi:micrococcal nuclease